jgi:hypothetical protein
MTNTSNHHAEIKLARLEYAYDQARADYANTERELAPHKRAFTDATYTLSARHRELQDFKAIASGQEAIAALRIIVALDNDRGSKLMDASPARRKAHHTAEQALFKYDDICRPVKGV